MNKRNTGLSLLKIIMSFVVVVCHFGSGGIILSLAVPCFMLMSFILTKDIIIDQNDTKIKNRMYRLLVPHIVWSTIIFFALISIGVTVKTSDLLWQISSGSSPVINPPMWFQMDLTLLFIGMILLFRFIDKKYVFTFICFLVVATLFAQYSELNTLLFDSLRYEMKYTLGRLSEMFPYAAIGVMMAHFQVLEFFEKLRKRTIAFLIMMVFVLCQYSFFNDPNSGFGYSGIKLIVLAVSIVMLFYLLPFHMVSIQLCALIDRVSRLSLGIYCMHFCIGNGVNKFLTSDHIPIGSLRECFLIYTICLFIAYGISLLPFDCCKKLVV